MKMIDKVLENNSKLVKETVIEEECPKAYGYEGVIEHCTINGCQEECCEECWNREIEEAEG